jgi:site-specific DNA-methyltransferase (adenine-specific)
MRSARRFIARADDGLAQPGTGVCWLNPPYGWPLASKAADAARGGATVVALVPARTDTRCWHDIVSQAKEVRYLQGRLKFGGAGHSDTASSNAIGHAAFATEDAPFIADM